MLHRTRLVYEQRDRGLAAVDEIAEIVAERLGWDAARTAAEVDSYRARCDAEEAASFEHGDAEAEQVRLNAADITPMVPLGGPAEPGTKPDSPASSRASSGPAGT